MNVDRLLKAIERVRNHTPAADSRAATYLRTYPALLALARCIDGDDASRFLQLATMTYGWMPRILRLDSKHIDKAIDAFRQARATPQDALDFEPVEYVAACLRSIVGASKLLHFANPEVFPIWDRNVERFRLGINPSQHHMGQTKNYTSYAQKVHETRRASTFSKFYEAF